MLIHEIPFLPRRWATTLRITISIHSPKAFSGNINTICIFCSRRYWRCILIRLALLDFIRHLTFVCILLQLSRIVYLILNLSCFNALLRGYFLHYFRIRFNILKSLWWILDEATSSLSEHIWLLIFINFARIYFFSSVVLILSKHFTRRWNSR